MRRIYQIFTHFESTRPSYLQKKNAEIMNLTLQFENFIIKFILNLLTNQFKLECLFTELNLFIFAFAVKANSFYIFHRVELFLEICTWVSLSSLHMYI